LPRDFDQERQAGVAKRDLDFTVGGETFHVVPFVPPEHLDAFQPTNRPAGKDIMDVYDEWILSMIVEEDRPKWEKVRKPVKDGGADPPVELHTIETIVFWLVEVATGRPTERPSSSRSGPQPQEAGSQGRSPSRVQAA
jgi:hypothetical protein